MKPASRSNCSCSSRVGRTLPQVISSSPVCTGKPSRQEVRRAHPVLEGAEHMLDGASTEKGNPTLSTPSPCRAGPDAQRVSVEQPDPVLTAAPPRRQCSKPQSKECKCPWLRHITAAVVDPQREKHSRLL